MVEFTKSTFWLRPSVTKLLLKLRHEAMITVFSIQFNSIQFNSIGVGVEVAKSILMIAALVNEHKFLPMTSTVRRPKVVFL